MTPHLFLAPMEGVTDWVMRDTLTQLGGIDQCVTEFLRITDQLMPDSVFFKICPELKSNSRTRAGTPVFLQLLGGQANPMAENALKAAELGALGIDLNFGCPAKTVNRHDGGAVLLKSSERLFQIASAVRNSVPSSTPVTAKIRLGYDDPSQCLDNVQALTEAGVHWITVHCRTKVDGYRPPAYWDWLPRIQEKTHLPLIANGEIWSVADYERCRETSGCQSFMIGRGVMAFPSLFQDIKKKISQEPMREADWKTTSKLLLPFYQASELYHSDAFAVARTKQWLRQLAQRYPEGQELFDKIKIHHDPTQFYQELEKSLLSL